MNIKKMNLLIDSINHCMYAYVIAAVAAPIIYSLTLEKASLYTCLLILPILLYIYYVRSFCTIWILYLFLHILLFLGVLFLPISIAPKIILELLVTIYGIAYFFKKIPRQNAVKEALSFYLVIPIVVCQIAYNTLDYKFLNPYLLNGFIICCVLYFISYYLINLRNYYIFNYERTTTPLKELKKMQNKLAAYFIGATGIFLFLISRFRLSKITNFLGYLMIEIIRFFASFFPHKKDTVEEIITTEPEPALQPPKDYNFKTNIFFRILNDLLMIAIIIIIVIIIIKRIIPILQYFRKYTYKNSSTSAIIEKEYLSPFQRTTKKVDSPFKLSQGKHLLRFNHRDRIRKHFYKQLKPKINIDTAAVHTSKELTQSLNEPTSRLKAITYSTEDLDSLQKLYDKARYSNEECTKDDYQAMKKLKL